MLVFLGGQFGAKIALDPGRQLTGEFAEMVARADLHLYRCLVQLGNSGIRSEMDPLKQPVRQQRVLVVRELH